MVSQWKTMTDFGSVGILPLTESVVNAIPIFFPVTLFVVWLFLSGASYTTILKATGKKRFWHTLTATSFVIFLSSLLIAGQNSSVTTFLNGYWVGFYILMTLASWFMLSNYK